MSSVAAPTTIKKEKTKIVKTKTIKLKVSDIFTKSLLSRQVTIPFTNIGNNIKSVLEEKIVKDISGKCTVEGYIQPNSISIISYSSGVVKSTDVTFSVSFNCNICNPVEGTTITVVALNITKAGIKAKYVKDPSPVTIFVARDYHYQSPSFSTIKAGDVFDITVLGQRFELNDSTISIMGEIIEKPKKVDAVPRIHLQQ